MPPGGASVSRRAIADIVRAAVLGSYGVTGLAASPLDRAAAWFGLGHAGISIAMDDGVLELGLDLEIAYGLPVAEVARQVDSAVRYAIQRALGRTVGDLRIRVDGLVVRPAATTPVDADPGGVPPDTTAGTKRTRRQGPPA